MYLFIQKFHAGWAYLTLFILAFVVVKTAIGFIGKQAFKPIDRKLGLFGLIFCHLQLLVGLILYFISPIGYNLLKANGISGLTPQLRLTALEHPVVNIIAIIIITIGWSKHKKLAESTSKFKTFLIFYGLGLILILSRIPWRLWL
jgi:phage-related holin